VGRRHAARRRSIVDQLPADQDTDEADNEAEQKDEAPAPAVHGGAVENGGDSGADRRPQQDAKGSPEGYKTAEKTAALGLRLLD